MIVYFLGCPLYKFILYIKCHVGGYQIYQTVYRYIVSVLWYVKCPPQPTPLNGIAYFNSYPLNGIKKWLHVFQPFFFIHNVK